MTLENWLSRYFRGSFNKRTGEVTFPCPRCKHTRFYFNLHKKVGYCHHARCHWKPSLADLVKIVGHSPEDPSGPPIYARPVPEPSQIVELPERADRLTYMKDGLIFSKFPLASEQIKDRGVDLQSQYIFDIHLGEGRIFIPIYYEGKLVSYVGRACWWIPEIRLRYKYPSGTRVTDYLFNWDGVKQEKTLILVENTFNAIWINNNLGPCTSTFGSNLSDSQITLITSGHFASVVILWDEGADMSAYKAVKKLRAASTPATYVMIDGQPDDHSLSFLREVTETGYKKAVEGGFNWTNYRKKK